MNRVVIMAGGTGGHIYPALACAEDFKKKGMEVHWLGSKGGMEESIVPQNEIPLHTLSIKGVRGKGLLGLVSAPFRILHALGQAIAIMQSIKPDVVLGMGGFVAGPGGVAAKLLGIPLAIHEQNAIAGTTNKLLAKVASLRMQAFNKALPKALTLGNPVRSDILHQQVRASRFDSARPLRLLVVGGSLGAKAINDMVPKVLAEWPFSQRLDIWHQTGKRNFTEVQNAYRSLGVEARVEPYLENMNHAYYWADVVLCRSGAMTVSELAIAGLPSILVPFPFAIDDHQTENARHLEKVGAAYMLPQSELSSEKVISLLAGLLESDETLLKMGEQAKLIAHPRATQDVVAHCLRLVKS